MNQELKKIFQSDIEIPEIVQSKAGLAFSQIQTERHDEVTDMKDRKKEHADTPKTNWRKPFSAMAACAALIVIAAAGSIYVNHQQKLSQPENPIHASSDTASSDTPNNSAETDSSDTQGTTIKNPFTMTVYAADTALKSGSPVPVTIGSRALDWNLTGDPDTDTVSYCLLLPLTCEGENIESVTYQINKGAFQVVGSEENSILLDSTPYDGVVTCGTNGDAVKYPTHYYTEFTVAYDKQTDDQTWISFCNDNVAVDDAEMILHQYDDTYLDSFQKLIEGVVISCTANYKDGTKKTALLNAGAYYGSLSELPSDADDTSSTQNSILFTLELQP